MLYKIPFEFAINAMLVILSLVIVFHLLILTQTIPYDIVWGGRLQNASQMRLFEIVSISINFFLLSVIAVKGKLVRTNIPNKVINVVLWFFVILFSLNTIGNLLAETTTETIVFTPITLVSAILCFRIVSVSNVKDG